MSMQRPSAATAASTVMTGRKTPGRRLRQTAQTADGGRCAPAQNEHHRNGADVDRECAYEDILGATSRQLPGMIRRRRLLPLELMTEFWERRQEPDEKTSDYIEDKARLARRLRLPDEQFVVQLRRHTRDARKHPKGRAGPAAYDNPGTSHCRRHRGHRRPTRSAST